MDNLGVIADRILDYLNDNLWKDITDLTRHIGLQEDNSSLILDFLERFGFISLDETRNKVKLSKAVMKIVQPKTEIIDETYTILKKTP